MPQFEKEELTYLYSIYLLKIIVKIVFQFDISGHPGIGSKKHLQMAICLVPKHAYI